MSIRHRITLLVILTFVAISSIGGYAVFQSRGSAYAVRSVTEGVVPSALASADLVSQLKDVQLAVMTLVSAPDNSLAAQASQKLSAEEKRLQESIELQSAHAGSKVQKGLVEQARESLEHYFSAIDETVKNKLAGKSELAQASFFGSVVQYQVELQGIVDTLRIEKNRSKDSAISSLNESLATTATTISIATAFAVIFLAVIGIFLYRAIIGPISRMQVMMTEIASSQDFTRRVPINRMDEIGRSIAAFNGMIEKIQESSAQLKQKTADIQTMLQNIPPGILTVVQGNRIHPEYSAYLETVFETKNIVGRDMMDLVFANTTLSADVIAQVDAAVSACIGEELMNFEFNEHLMVGEIEKAMADGRTKILDLNWSPITDDAGRTVRLMLCVRDVTELRKLAAEAHEQKRELQIIGEILAVSHEKFHEFIAGSLKFVDENEQIVRQHPQPSAYAVAMLFRNMHTIKGNSRTYGLQHLTTVVHEAEQSYEALRRADAHLSWDQRILMGELAGVRAEIAHYAKINEEVLGRRSGVERYLMVDKKHIQESLHRLETVNTANLHELVAVRNAVRKTLRLLGTERISQTLAGVLESIPSLARQLGKAQPIVKIEENDYVVHTHASTILKNVFVHLIRNAIDHGIEPPELRRAQGKSAEGTICLAMKVEEGMLQVSLSDDGRGLALARIREMAIEKGLADPHGRVDDEEIVRLIFQPGFSTAEKVTEVSGRGVGMDAVQEFVKREGGKIEIQFDGGEAGSAYRQFRIVVFLPGSFAVKISGGDEHYANGINQTSPGRVIGNGSENEDLDLGDLASSGAEAA